MWRALRSRNFKLYFAGQGVSLIGTWMQQIAMSWLVYRLTGSSAMLGLITFLTQVPVLVLSPFFGVLTDRYPLKKLILLTQAAALAQAAIIAVLTLTNHASIPVIAILSLFLGVITALDMPVRQAFMIELVEDRKLLPNALALHAALTNAARLIGPAAAAIFIGLIGEGWCFALNAASYAFVLVALALTRVRPRTDRSVRQHMRREFILGFQYLREKSSLLSVVLTVAAISLFGNSFLVIMPVFSDQVLHGGADTLGLLLAASGCGALIGALALASKRELKTLHTLMWFSFLLLGVLLFVLSLTSAIGLALICMVISGYFLVNINAGANLYLQTAVRDSMRGRVMSMFSLAFLGVPALGGLLAGLLSQTLGVTAAIGLLGGATLLSALVFKGRIAPLHAD